MTTFVIITLTNIVGRAHTWSGTLEGTPEEVFKQAFYAAGKTHRFGFDPNDLSVSFYHTEELPKPRKPRVSKAKAAPSSEPNDS